MNSSLSNKQLDEEENDEEIISTSMSLITTSSTRSLINTKQKENETSTFKFNRNDINRYHHFDSKIENKQKQHQQPPLFNISKLCNDNDDSNFDSSYDEDNNNYNDDDDDESTTNTNDSLELVSINKSSINDLLLETGVYVSNIVKKKHAQLSVGDRILSINGHSLTNKTLYEIMDLIENVSQFKLVIRKQPKKIQKQKRESGRRNRGFIVVSQSNMSSNNNNNNNNSNSLLNQTIHSVNEIKTSSNLIFDIKDQKEIKKQINKTVLVNKSKTHKVPKSTPPPPSAPPVDLIHHQNQVKKYYAQKLAHIEQKEQNLLDENLNKYQELIKNFHSQSRKCDQLYVDLDVIEANNNNIAKNSKNSLFKFHKTSPYLIDDIEKHDTLSLSNASPLPLDDDDDDANDDDDNKKRVSIKNSKKFRKSNTQPDQLKFIQRHSAPTPVQDS